MKAILMMVGVEDNEFPEGGVLLECPENYPEKSEVPFLLITPRSNGLAIERIADLRRIVIREKGIGVKQVADSMWDVVYRHYQPYLAVTVPVAVLLRDNFDTGLISHVLLGFEKTEVKKIEPVRL